MKEHDFVFMSYKISDSLTQDFLIVALYLNSYKWIKKVMNLQIITVSLEYKYACVIMAAIVIAGMISDLVV